jgi:hypothetical protein|tara:strand:+ start:469 stop:903 length:435 start_codon:yes stop_codon:yes gene_type:complete
MTNRRGVLLASFIITDDEQKIQEEVEFIVNNIEITNNLIFLLQDTENPEKKIITYNAVVEKGKPFNPRLFTMRMHRKKQTNTLYTINALNAAVASQHEGKTGKDLKLDWTQYENSILLTAGKELKVHPVEVNKIFKIEDEPVEE